MISSKETLFSKCCIRALRSSGYLIEEDENCYITIRELRNEPGISCHFLTKVLQQLTKQGVSKSKEGPDGGVKLVKNPDEVTFSDSMYSVDGSHIKMGCALDRPDCGELNLCMFNKNRTGFSGADDTYAYS